MKNILIGCGVIVVLIVIGLLVAGYFGVKFAKNIGEDIKEIQTSVSTLNVEFPFEEPVDGLISEARLEKWMTVRDEMLPTVASIDSMFQNFSLKTFASLKGTMTHIIEQYTLTLRNAELSPDEYSWISQQIYGTIQSGDVRYDASLKALYQAVEDIQNRENEKGVRTSFDDWDAPVTAAQIRKNIQYLKTHKERILKTVKVFYSDAFLESMDEMWFNKGDDEEDF